MNNTARKLTSAAIAGGLVAIASTAAVLIELPPGATLADIGSVGWAAIALGGIAVALKDVKTFLADPPK